MSWTTYNFPPAAASAPTRTALTDSEIAALSTEQKLAHDWQDDELRRALAADHSWLHEDATKAAILKRWILWGQEPAGKLADALALRGNSDHGCSKDFYWSGLKAPFAMEDEDKKQEKQEKQEKSKEKEAKK